VPGDNLILIEERSWVRVVGRATRPSDRNDGARWKDALA
jgi:hypothetical protein